MDTYVIAVFAIGSNSVTRAKLLQNRGAGHFGHFGHFGHTSLMAAQAMKGSLNQKRPNLRIVQNNKQPPNNR